MNSKVLCQTAINTSCKNKWASDHLFPDNSSKNIFLFTRIIDLYARSIQIEVGALTRLTDLNEIDKITVSVFVRIWEARLKETAGKRPGQFVYDLMLQEAFRYLHNQGMINRISYLQNILQINPVRFVQLIAPPKLNSNQTNLLNLN